MAQIEELEVRDVTGLADAWKRRVVLSSTQVGKILIDAGLLPPHCKRFIIDCDTNQAVKIYYECFGDQETLDLVFKELATAISPKPMGTPNGKD